MRLPLSSILLPRVVFAVVALFLGGLVFGGYLLLNDPALALSKKPSSRKPYLPNEMRVPLSPLTLITTQPVEVDLQFNLPPAHHLNPDAPSRVIVTSPEDPALYLTLPLADPRLKASIPARPSGRGTLELSALVYYCEEGNKQLCLIRGVSFSQPYEAIPSRRDNRVEHGAQNRLVAVADLTD